MSPFIDENTRKKFVVYSGRSFSGLSAYIEQKYIPEFLGGKCKVRYTVCSSVENTSYVCGLQATNGTFSLGFKAVSQYELLASVLLINCFLDLPFLWSCQFLELISNIRESLGKFVLLALLGNTSARCRWNSLITQL